MPGLNDNQSRGLAGENGIGPTVACETSLKTRNPKHKIPARHREPELVQARRAGETNSNFSRIVKSPEASWAETIPEESHIRLRSQIDLS